METNKSIFVVSFSQVESLNEQLRQQQERRARAEVLSKKNDQGEQTSDRLTMHRLV